MTTWFLAGSLALAVLGGVAVVAFESPTRSAGGLITAFLGVAAACAALGAPVVPGFVLWVGAGGTGLLLLASVLLLNLREDERGARRFRLRPALAAPLLVVLWAALAKVLLSDVAVRQVRTNSGLPLGSALSAFDVRAAVVGPLAVPFTAALVALAATLIVAIALVRRRA